MTHKVLCIVGTRPEAIKMAPVIKALQAERNIACRVLATAQHRGLLDQILDGFAITADLDLDIMRPNQSLAALTSRLLLELDNVLQAEQPDVVLAQGDTTTVMSAALACFYRQIPFGHVEAGLRTGTSAIRSPRKPTGSSPASSLAGISRPPRAPWTTCCAKASAPAISP